MCTGAAGAVLPLNALYRRGARGDVEPDEEESRREYFDTHGDRPTQTARGRGHGYQR